MGFVAKICRKNGIYVKRFEVLGLRTVNQIRTLLSTLNVNVLFEKH